MLKLGQRQRSPPEPFPIPLDNSSKRLRVSETSTKARTSRTLRFRSVLRNLVTQLDDSYANLVVRCSYFFGMKSLSHKAFEVFDFNPENELEQPVAERFRNPKLDRSPLAKYNFLEHFARTSNARERNGSDVSCTDVDARCGNQEHEGQCSSAYDTSEGKCAFKGVSGLDESPLTNCTTSREQTLSSFDGTLPEIMLSERVKASSCGIDTMSCGEQVSQKQRPECSLPSNSRPVDLNSDDDDDRQTSPQSTHSSEIRENEGSSEDSALDHSPRSWTMESLNTAVVAVVPDYLIYGDRYCTESLLTFSCSGIKLEGRNACGSKELLCFEWEITEIDEIKSQWFARVETALVNLCIRLTADVGTEFPHGTSGNVGNAELKFAVCDSCWSGTQERIMSMDERYKSAWKVLLDNDVKGSDDSIGNGTCNSKGYFSTFDKSFEDVIYPKGDPDAVSISMRDVELLQPETFINDTIIDFYVKYLKNNIKPEDLQRFHFFNSFFFRKLADMDKNPSSASEGRAAFLRVRKWTRKVNLFEKDYLFIPVNFNLHWSLIVVCHPGEIIGFIDEDIRRCPKVPCILHMDSIKGSHKGLKNLVQSYLWEEWRERHTDSSEDASSKFFNLRFIPLENTLSAVRISYAEQKTNLLLQFRSPKSIFLDGIHEIGLFEVIRNVRDGLIHRLPQQENSFDCGLFLLHYVELFLEEAPACFNPFKITEFSNFLNMDWFPPAEASLKRAHIQKIVYGLIEDYSPKMPTAASDECYHSSQHMEDCNREENVELFLETDNTEKECNGLVLRELLEPGTAEGSSQNEQFQSLDLLNPFPRFKAFLSPVEEVEEDEQIACSPSDGTDCHRLAEITADACAPSFTSKSFAIFDSICKPGRRMHEDEHQDDDSITETSSFGSQCSLEARMDECLSDNHLVHLNRLEETEKPSLVSLEDAGRNTESPASASSKRLEACVVEDSQEDDKTAESEESKESFSSCQENPLGISYQFTGLDENENSQLKGSGLPAEINEERAAKRMKVAHASEGKIVIDEEA